MNVLFVHKYTQMSQWTGSDLIWVRRDLCDHVWSQNMKCVSWKLGESQCVWVIEQKLDMLIYNDRIRDEKQHEFEWHGVGVWAAQ